VAKYMYIGSYTQDGVRGLLKDGGTGRRGAVEQVFASVGGKLESIHWAFGKDDFVVIGELPDNAAAAAASLTIAAAGAVSLRTVPLMTADEVDEAIKRRVDYRAPGA
jgi:uncharacterized protein with GYD domain